MTGLEEVIREVSQRREALMAPWVKLSMLKSFERLTSMNSQREEADPRRYQMALSEPKLSENVKAFYDFFEAKKQRGLLSRLGELKLSRMKESPEAFMFVDYQCPYTTNHLISMAWALATDPKIHPVIHSGVAATMAEGGSTPLSTASSSGPSLDDPRDLLVASLNQMDRCTYGTAYDLILAFHGVHPLVRVIEEPHAYLADLATEYFKEKLDILLAGDLASQRRAWHILVSRVAPEPVKDTKAESYAQARLVEWNREREDFLEENTEGLRRFLQERAASDFLRVDNINSAITDCMAALSDLPVPRVDILSSRAYDIFMWFFAGQWPEPCRETLARIQDRLFTEIETKERVDLPQLFSSCGLGALRSVILSDESLHSVSSWPLILRGDPGYKNVIRQIENVYSTFRWFFTEKEVGEFRASCANVTEALSGEGFRELREWAHETRHDRAIVTDFFATLHDASSEEKRGQVQELHNLFSRRPDWCYTGEQWTEFHQAGIREAVQERRSAGTPPPDGAPNVVEVSVEMDLFTCNRILLTGMFATFPGDWSEQFYNAFSAAETYVTTALARPNLSQDERQVLTSSFPDEIQKLIKLTSRIYRFFHSEEEPSLSEREIQGYVDCLISLPPSSAVEHLKKLVQYQNGEWLRLREKVAQSLEFLLVHERLSQEVLAAIVNREDMALFLKEMIHSFSQLEAVLSLVEGSPSDYLAGLNLMDRLIGRRIHFLPRESKSFFDILALLPDPDIERYFVTAIDPQYGADGKVQVEFSLAPDQEFFSKFEGKVGFFGKDAVVKLLKGAIKDIKGLAFVLQLVGDSQGDYLTKLGMMDKLMGWIGSCASLRREDENSFSKILTFVPLPIQLELLERFIRTGTHPCRDDFVCKEISKIVGKLPTDKQVAFLNEERTLFLVREEVKRCNDSLGEILTLVSDVTKSPPAVSAYLKKLGVMDEQVNRFRRWRTRVGQDHYFPEAKEVYQSFYKILDRLPLADAKSYIDRLRGPAIVRAFSRSSQTDMLDKAYLERRRKEMKEGRGIKEGSVSDSSSDSQEGPRFRT